MKEAFGVSKEKKSFDDETTKLAVSRAISGNPDEAREAIGILYQDHFDKVKGVVFRIVKNSETTEEIAQQIFLELPKTIRSFKGEAKFSTWLYIVAQRKALKYLLSSQTLLEKNSVGDFSDIFKEPSNSNNNYRREEDKILERIENDRLHDKLIKAVKELPPGQKSIVELRLKGFSEEEIAEKIGIVVGTVKSQFSNAIKNLRKKIKKENKD